MQKQNQMTEARLHEIDAEICRRSFYEFFVYFWTAIEEREPELNWHIEYLCDELQDIAERVFLKSQVDDNGKTRTWRDPLSHNLIVNISPGETKSSICTIFFPAWCWTRDPSLRIVTASYSATLSMDHAQKSRDIIRSEKYRTLFPEVEIRQDMDAKLRYGNTKGGKRLVTSVGGTITGLHGDILIIDDPIDPKGSKSEAERKTANEWMTETLPTRKTDLKVTPTILIMQRLHEEDPTSVMAKTWEATNRLKWIRLPATDEYPISPEELADRYTADEGGVRVMNPLRRPISVVRDLEATLGSMEAACQLGQDATPAGGLKLKRDWFSARFTLGWLENELKWKARDEPVWNWTMDGAYTNEKKNSATALLVWSIWGNRLYLRNYIEVWYEFHEGLKYIPGWLAANGVNKRSLGYIEPKASGKSYTQVWRSRGNLNVVEDQAQAKTDDAKIVRVERCAPFIQGGGLVLCESTDWERFIYVCASFPQVKHDDLVDCLTMAVDKVDVTSQWDAWKSLKKNRK